jgi:tetratricopeptide (TPR) repeat protein
MFGFFRRRKAKKLLQAAQEARAEGQLERAGALLQEVIDLGEPEQAGHACIVLAAIVRARGEHGEAARLLASARAFLPHEAAIDLQRGEDLRASGQHAEALRALDETLGRAGLPAAIADRATRLGALSAFVVRAPDARKRLEEAVDRYALDCEAWSCLARLHAAEGRHTEADAALRHIARAYRDDLEAQERRFALSDAARAQALAALWRPEPAAGLDDDAASKLFDHLRSAESERAIAIARSLGEPSADRPKAAALLAFVEMRAGHVDEAKRALAEAGDLPLARFVTAISLLDGFEEDEARQALERRREEALPFPAVTYLLATCRDVEGDLDGAEALYQEVLQVDPDDAEVMLLVADLHRRRGHEDEAHALELRAYRLSPALLSGGGRFRPDLVARRRGLAAKRRSELRLREAPDDSEARLHLLQACNQLSNYRATLAAAGDQPFTGPLRADLHREIGYAHFALGELAPAANALRRCLELAPDDAVAHMRLGEVLARLERHDEATQQLDAALAAKPGAFHALATKAILLSMRGKAKAAAPLYRAAMRADPTQGEPHLNLAVDLIKGGKMAEAERELRFAVALLPDDAQAHKKHAEALSALGRGDEAARVMDRAQSLMQRDMAKAALGGVPPPMRVDLPSPFKREMRTVLAELAKQVCA